MKRLVSDPAQEQDFQPIKTLQHSHKVPFMKPLGNLDRVCKEFGSSLEYCRLKEGVSFVVDGKWLWDNTLDGEKPLGFVFPCSDKSVVGKLGTDMYLDTNGLVFDIGRLFGTSQSEDSPSQLCAPETKIEAAGVIATPLAPLGLDFETQILPRLLFLIESIPTSAQVALPAEYMYEEHMKLLSEAELIEHSRFIPLWPTTLKHVKELYLVSEDPHCSPNPQTAPELLSLVRTAMAAATRRVDGVVDFVTRWSQQSPTASDSTSLRSQLQDPKQHELWDMLVKTRWLKRLESGARPPGLILIMDVGVGNNAAFITYLKRRFQFHQNLISYFDPTGIPLSVTISLLNYVDVLVGRNEHLSKLVYLPKSSLVVEVLAKEGPVSSHFYTVASNMDIKYGVVFYTPEEAVLFDDIADVIEPVVQQVQKKQ